MSRPTHLLRHEHRVIAQALRALEGMCLRMQIGYSVPSEELAKLLDFLQNFADKFHHAREEAHLFPALEQLGIRDGHGPLGFLREEHATERELLGELELAVEAYRRDHTASASFVSAARQFKDHLSEHMQQEDAILFRLAEEMLDDQVKDSLIHAFAAESAEARDLIQHYEQLAIELEKAWST